MTLIRPARSLLLLLPLVVLFACSDGGWISTNYDTIWTVTLDAQGNLTIHNALCEGIDSSKLPDGPPLF